MAKKLGYQEQLFYGAAGSTAATLLKCRVDVTTEITPEIGDTTCAGDGTAPPDTHGAAVAITKKISFNMRVDSDASAAATFIAAANGGGPIALKCGAFDEDCVISVKEGFPLKGEQTIDVASEAIVERPA